MKRNLLTAAATLCVALMLVACAAKSPKEKVIDALNDAIERADEATTRKKLDCASQLLMMDLKNIFKGKTQLEQNQVMNSKEVLDLQTEFNKHVAEKRKVVR